MVTHVGFDLLADICAEPGWDRDPTSKVPAQSIPAQAGSSVPTQQRGKPLIYEVRKDYNKYLGNFVELEAIGPLEVGPLEPEHSCMGIDCPECFNRGLRYGDWLLAKKLRDANGF